MSAVMTWLLIDDDAVFRGVLARALGRRGQRVREAASAEAALAAVRTQAPERVLLDLRLERDSGLRLLPELLALAPAAEVVVLTGYASITTAVDAIKLGAVNYLSKPVEVADILNAFEAEPASTADVDDEGPMSVDRLEWEHIQRVLAEHDGNISATARALGMHRRTLQRKLQKRPVKR